jgi:hypothetical protein
MTYYITTAQIPVSPSISKGKTGIFAISPYRAGVKNVENLVYNTIKPLFIYFSLNHYSR